MWGRYENQEETMEQEESVNQSTNISANLTLSLLFAAGSGAMLDHMVSSIDSFSLDSIMPALMFGTACVTGATIIAKKGVYDIVRNLYQTENYHDKPRCLESMQEGNFGAEEGIPEQEERHGIEDWQMYEAFH